MKYQLTVAAVLLLSVFATFYIHAHGGFYRYTYVKQEERWDDVLNDFSWDVTPPLNRIHGHSRRCRKVSAAHAGHAVEDGVRWWQCPNYPWPIAGP